MKKSYFTDDELRSSQSKSNFIKDTRSHTANNNLQAFYMGFFSVHSVSKDIHNESKEQTELLTTFGCCSQVVVA